MTITAASSTRADWGNCWRPCGLTEDDVSKMLTDLRNTIFCSCIFSPVLVNKLLVRYDSSSCSRLFCKYWSNELFQGGLVHRQTPVVVARSCVRRKAKSARSHRWFFSFFPCWFPSESVAVLELRAESPFVDSQSPLVVPVHDRSWQVLCDSLILVF